MTSGQREVLNALTDGPCSTRDIANVRRLGTYDGVYKALRRLEDRGLVRHTYHIGYSGWTLTPAGRAVLDLTAPASEGKGGKLG